MVIKTAQKVKDKKAIKKIKKSTPIKKGMAKAKIKAVPKDKKKTAKKVEKKKTATKAVKKAVKKVTKPAPKMKVKTAAKKITEQKKLTTKKGTSKVSASIKKEKPKTTRKMSDKTTMTTVTKPRKPKKVYEVQQENIAVLPMTSFDEVVAYEPSATMAGPVHFTPYKIHENEEYMNEAQREHFRLILMAWKKQLMAEVDTTVDHMKQEVLSYPDPLDRAAQEEGFNLELRTRDRERKLIKKIEQSLDAINKNEYGYCEDCGAEIGVRRLEARPTAVKCIDCKTYQEIREKQIGG